MTESTSLYPVNQIGSDGFNWWIGQVESVKADDAKGGDRWKVRIVGIHPRDCNTVKSEDLPWARVVMPVHAPHITGAATSVTTQLEPGAWVVGFFLDIDKQQPVIIGSIGRDPNSDGEDVSDDPSPSESGCKSFTTFLNPENKIVYDQLIEDKNKPSITETGHLGDGTDREESVGVDEGVKAIHGKNTPANPGGIQFCVEVADKCGKETDMKKTFTRLFSEMLRDVQDNNGQLGDYVVGQLGGPLYDAIDIGRKYVNKAIKIIRTFVAKIKGFVLEQIKKAVKAITNAVLRPSETGNSLTPVTEFFNKALKKLGCEMADLGDRLAKFLEDIIFGYLFNLYKQTACQVDKFVNGVVNKIQTLMSELLRSILGPLQDILGAIAEPLNMIGNAINYVLNLLGISCSGPPNDCAKTSAVCTTGKTDEREDFLDKLLKDVEGMNDSPGDWSQYICDDSFDGKGIDGTEVIFVGGIQDDSNTGNIIRYAIDDLIIEEGQIATFSISRWGKTDVASSVTYSTRDGSATKGKDYEASDGIIGFSPGVTLRTIDVRTFLDYDNEGDEDFFVKIFPDTPGTVTQMARKNIARCVIRESTVNDGTSGYNTPLGEVPQSDIPFSTSMNPLNDSYFEDPDEPEVVDDTTQPDTTDVDPTEVTPTYSVTSDKVVVKEGGFVTYTITTTNINTGTVLEYSLFGTNITPDDFVDRKMSGTIVIEDNTAKVVVGIAEDTTFETEENLTFSVVGTGASISVLIEADSAGFSDEEIIEADDGSTTTEPIIKKPSVPVVGDIVTGPGGEILDIPVDLRGDPYTELPFVLISGNGFSGAAIPLSDDRGYITEIRVTDPGYGYKRNTPDNSGKECIIDSFTLLTPGREYTSTPTVYVNGDTTIAEAVINDRGQVISVRIKNREMTFASYPKVQIVGGGGYGAKFIPSFACLEPEARVKVGSAKIGTGSYVDCP